MKPLPTPSAIVRADKATKVYQRDSIPVPALPVRAPGRPEASHLIDLTARGFTLLVFGAARPDTAGLPLPVETLVAGEDFEDAGGAVAAAFGAGPGAVALIRPDQHVMGCWRRFERGQVAAALARVLHPGGTA